MSLWIPVTAHWFVGSGAVDEPNREQISALELSCLEDIAVHHPVVNELLGTRDTPAMSTRALMLWPNLFPYRDRDTALQSARPLLQAEGRRDYDAARLIAAPTQGPQDQST